MKNTNNLLKATNKRMLKWLRRLRTLPELRKLNKVQEQAKVQSFTRKDKFSLLLHLNVQAGYATQRKELAI